MSPYVSHFRDEEFADKLTGQGGIQDALREKLEAARNIAGIPFVITSGFRGTETQNDLIARGLSEPTSSHPKGLAVDIAAKDSRARALIVGAALKAGITRIGIAKTFIHLDIDDSKDPNLIWMY